jgi:4-hydroxy-3-polyprenylbenzoate decarboxylase
MERVVVGICGASGVILGCKTIELLIQKGLYVDVVMTDAARRTAQEEIDESFDPASYFSHPNITLHSVQNVGASIASGTYRCLGMAIVPCSMSTLAAIAIGLSDNLLRRAADVSLKERRRLVIVPREMPFSLIHLENMVRVTTAGAVIMPPQPAWYFHPKTIQDVESTIANRVVQQLGISSDLPEWQG